MKRVLLFALCCMLLLTSCTKQKDNTLVIYGYDSFGWVSDSLTQKFESDNNCTVEYISFESTAKIITRLLLEKSNPNADVAIGITPAMLARVKDEKLIRKYKSPFIDRITKTDLIFDKEFYTTPYDYGPLAVIYKPDRFSSVPKTFNDLLQYKKSIIIQDPRTSSTGTDFFLWTIAVYGDNWTDFWKSFKESVITTSPGWSESFAAFENDEASMMISYATDGAYSVHNYGSSAYKAFIPNNEGYIQIEGVSVVNGCNSPKLAEKFIDFMLSDTFQKEIPLNQWMFPVTDARLPEVFKHAVVPDSTVTLDSAAINANLDSWLADWEEIMIQ